jgi:hypothetical protein
MMAGNITRIFMGNSSKPGTHVTNVNSVLRPPAMAHVAQTWRTPDRQVHQLPDSWSRIVAEESPALLDIHFALFCPDCCFGMRKPYAL